MRVAHLALGIALLLFFSTFADAQDVVRLKNGKTLSGTILKDEDMTEGIKIRLWTTGGVIAVKWAQVPGSEKERLLGSAAEVGSDVLGEMLDGVRILTSNREVIGVLIEETADSYRVKSKDSPSPVSIPKTAVVKKDDQRIRESDAYSPSEMVERRAEGVAEDDAAGLFAVAEFARGLKLYDTAEAFYAKCKEADASRTEDVDAILEKMVALRKEKEAEDALTAIKKLIDDTKYQEALDAVESWMTDFSETAVVKRNENLVASIEAEWEDFKNNQDAFLAKKVPDEWTKLRKKLFRTYANKREYKFDAARAAAAKIDEEIKKALSEKLKTSPEKIAEHWSAREKKSRESGNYSTGSWIPLGGQDGGYDYTGTGSNNGGANPATGGSGDFGNRFGNRGGNRGNKPKKPQKNENKKLQTRQEWWESVGSSTRQNFIEAHYAQNSSLCTDQEEKRTKCSQCRGNGSLKSTRYGQSVDVLCPRCHGSAEELKVYYK